MTRRHYDVVVLGRSLGALSAAALLARRDFTVLVLGQGERLASYRLGARSLRRRAFTMLAGTSPAWNRIVVELAQSQTWKRNTVPASPMFQVLAPGMRLDVEPDMALLAREVDREFSALRRLVDELYDELARVNGAADDAFDRDAVWPPGNFWERRETGRFAAMLPYVRAEPDADLLVDFPRAHVFRQVVNATVAFATHLSTFPPPFAVARLHGAWTRGLVALDAPDPEAALEEFLVQRIEAHGGRCLLGERAASLEVRRGTASGVVIDGDEHPTGAGFVLTDSDGETVAALAGGEGLHKRALREWPRITSSAGRFVVSVAVRTEGLPGPLGREAFLLPENCPPTRGGPQPSRPRPLIHLQRHPGGSGEDLLVAETLLPDRGGLALHEAREVVLEALCAELPFLAQHLLVADSPHDGLPVWRFDQGRRFAEERATLEGSAPGGPEPMLRQLEVDPPGYLDLGGEPLRGPIERTLLVGRSVLPGLGQEGQLLAAWGAARLVTRSDRRRERMRREMWSKVEIG